MSKLIDIIPLSQQQCSQPIRCELKYATADNFVGRIIDGYHPDAKNVCLLTEKVGNILCEVQNNLIKNYQWGLQVFDAYRPRRAVLDFMRWVQQPPSGEKELQQKSKHYPHLEKSQLFHLGYLSEDSQHCYGNTVDCVLFDLKNNQLLDMGTVFDFFGEQSHSTAISKKIGENAHRHRKILLQVMEQFGFKVARTEYWHFTHLEAKEISLPLDIPILEAVW